jgi:hypothetical protein
MTKKSGSSSGSTDSSTSQQNGGFTKKAQGDSSLNTSKSNSSRSELLEFEKTKEFLQKKEQILMTRLRYVRLWVLLVLAYFLSRLAFL